MLSELLPLRRLAPGKGMLRKLSIALCTAAVLSAGCATPASRTNELRPGMTPADVISVLGEPGQSQFVDDLLIWRYTLHNHWKGLVPYYLAFHQNQLIGWEENLEEYYANQALWAQSLPRRHDVHVSIED